MELDIPEGFVTQLNEYPDGLLEEEGRVTAADTLVGQISEGEQLRMDHNHDLVAGFSEFLCSMGVEYINAFMKGSGQMLDGDSTTGPFDLAAFGTGVFEGGKGGPASGPNSNMSHGQCAIWGGAGGANGNFGGTVGGTSIWGGNGSLGVHHGGSNPQGEVPGGGGSGRGGDSNGGGGDGAAGQVKIWIFG